LTRVGRLTGVTPLLNSALALLLQPSGMDDFGGGARLLNPSLPKLPTP